MRGLVGEERRVGRGEWRGEERGEEKKVLKKGEEEREERGVGDKGRHILIWENSFNFIIVSGLK